MKLQLIVHTALDELRMLMLGTQVLFGFQLQAAFQEGFTKVSSDARIADAVALSFVVITLGLLIAGPAQHRLVEQGNASKRILSVANRFAETALVTFAVALGCNVYVVGQPRVGGEWALLAALAALVLALAFWIGLGNVLRRTLDIKERPDGMPQEEKPELHEKIDQMLTEARVILPGAQALFGFQFIVTLHNAFSALPSSVQAVHFASLAAIAITIMLLISPAAVHRITFGGRDAEQMHDIGAVLVTVALVPLALGISGDVFVALFKILNQPTLAGLIAVIAFIALAGLWYAVPLVLRTRLKPHPA
jgi:hypothetical protein